MKNEQEVRLTKLKCLRCDWEWFPKAERLPVRCPKCGSPYWNIPKGEKKEGATNVKVE